MMIDTTARQLNQTVSAQLHRTSINQAIGFACLIGTTGIIGLMMYRNNPSIAILGWAVYFAGMVAIVYQPRYGVYMLVGFTLLGDQVLISWYPFAKNFSSGESLLYANSHALSFSPLETYIALTFLVWMGQAVMQRRLRFYTGPLFWPAILFFAFIIIGLLYGLSRGGNKIIALWEMRPICYLFAMLVLTSNLIRTRTQVNLLLWIAPWALFVRSLFGDWFVYSELHFQLSSVEAIAEHSFSIQLNTIYVILIAAWIYRDSPSRRIILSLMLPFVLLSYFANHRRAGFLALGFALVMLAVVLYRERRKVFWKVTPLACVFAVVYIAVFWNSSGVLGLPASALKSVIGLADKRDDASNEYRLIENVNIMYTIKAVPLMGVGFGNKFYILVPLPDISFFVWWEYITHNSIMWMWMKTGMGGFLAMLFLLGASIITGMRTLLRMPNGILSVAAITATLYVFMHFVYTYVDMGWESNSMIYVGMAMGLINCLHVIAARPEPVQAKRWPWQAEPASHPGLRPL